MPPNPATPGCGLPTRLRFPLAGLALAGIAAVALYLSRQTDASLTFWDATTTVLSQVAQYMLAKKWIENWWVWISVNVLYSGVYAFKGLYLTSAQQLVFIALSVMGYLAWRKELLGAPPALATLSADGLAAVRLCLTAAVSVLLIGRPWHQCYRVPALLPLTLEW